jgi:hypothetical protein
LFAQQALPSHHLLSQSEATEFHEPTAAGVAFFGAGAGGRILGTCFCNSERRAQEDIIGTSLEDRKIGEKGTVNISEFQQCYVDVHGVDSQSSGHAFNAAKSTLAALV